MTTLDLTSASREDLIAEIGELKEAYSDLEDDLSEARATGCGLCEGCGEHVDPDYEEIYCEKCAHSVEQVDLDCSRCGKLIGPGDQVVIGREPYSREWTFTHPICAVPQ